MREHLTHSRFRDDRRALRTETARAGRRTVRSPTPMALRHGVARRRWAVWLTVAWLAALWIIVFLQIREALLSDWAPVFAGMTMIALPVAGGLIARLVLTAPRHSEFAFTQPISPRRLVWLEWGGAMLTLTLAIALVVAFLVVPLSLVAAARQTEAPLPAHDIVRLLGIFFAVLSAWAAFNLLIRQVVVAGFVILLGTPLLTQWANGASAPSALLLTVAVGLAAPLIAGEAAGLFWQNQRDPGSGGSKGTRKRPEG